LAAASALAADWSSAAQEKEITLETTGSKGPHSVIVWCVVADQRLYVATDQSRKRKRWVRNLDRHPDARVTIHGEAYSVSARRVTGAEEWRAVMMAYVRKYGDELREYDFPKPDDLSSGRIYELHVPSRSRHRRPANRTPPAAPTGTRM
jgi:deazaflavin-dependent oxidoreductase (nitroreductase family)